LKKFVKASQKFHKKSLKIFTWLKVKWLKYELSILFNGLICQKVKYNFWSFYKNRRFFKAKRDICNRNAFLWMESFRRHYSASSAASAVVFLFPRSIGANKQKISGGNCSQNDIETAKQNGPIPLPDGKESAYNGFRIIRRPTAARTAVGLLDGSWDNQNFTVGGKNCKSRFRILKTVFCRACRGFDKRQNFAIE
jgi:hypothetical protein